MDSKDLIRIVPESSMVDGTFKTVSLADVLKQHKETFPLLIPHLNGVVVFRRIGALDRDEILEEFKEVNEQVLMAMPELEAIKAKEIKTWTDEDIKTVHSFNVRALPMSIAFIAACTVNPKLSRDEVKKLMDDMTDEQRGAFINICNDKLIGLTEDQAGGRKN